MYRSRLGGDLGEITMRYVSSTINDSEIIFFDIVGSQAHTLMLYQKGIIPREDAKKIIVALSDIQSKFSKEMDTKEIEHVMCNNDSTLMSNAEDIHELIEARVIKNAGMDSGGKMHTARSRNDQVSLDIRMKVRNDINNISNCLLDTIDALICTASEHQDTIMPLYTHLQQAQPGLFSHYLLAHADVLFRDFDRMSGTYERVNQSPLGACAVGGTSIHIDRYMTAKMLGFDGLVENSIDATSTRDFVAEYLSMLSILMTNLSRLAEDFVLWSTSEFSFIELADDFTSPSSIMPQKKNPDILELIRAKTAEVIGCLTATLTTIKSLATGYGRDLQQIKSSMWNASRICNNTLLILKPVILSMKVNKEQMKNAAESGNIVALDIAERLVLDCNVPFRVAHKIVGSLSQSAYLSKKRITKVTLDDIKISVEKTNIDPKLVENIIINTSIESSLKDRRSIGSSGYDEQKRMISDRVNKINIYRKRLQEREQKINNAFENLDSQVIEIINS